MPLRATHAEATVVIVAVPVEGVTVSGEAAVALIEAAPVEGVVGRGGAGRGRRRA